MLMKLKSLLLIAAASMAMSAAADVTVTNVADFLSIGDKNGDEISTPPTKGKTTEFSFLMNVVEITEANALQTTLVFPEGLTPSGDPRYQGSELATYDDEFEEWSTDYQFSGKWEESSKELLVIINGKAGKTVNFLNCDANSDGKIDLFHQRIAVAADAADKLIITPKAVEFWMGGETKYIGPNTPMSVTSVRAIEADKEVAGVKYYNVAGVESDKAFDGVNIMVTTYVDGSTKAVKVIK